MMDTATDLQWICGTFEIKTALKPCLGCCITSLARMRPYAQVIWHFCAFPVRQMNLLCMSFAMQRYTIFLQFTIKSMSVCKTTKIIRLYIFGNFINKFPLNGNWNFPCATADCTDQCETITLPVKLNKQKKMKQEEPEKSCFPFAYLCAKLRSILVDDSNHRTMVVYAVPCLAFTGFYNQILPPCSWF